MTPLKKCPTCGEEWITDQLEVTCLNTGVKTTLVTIEENPIDGVDEPYIPNPCGTGRHSLNEHYFEYHSKKSNKVWKGCKACRKERNLRSVKKYKARKKQEQEQEQELAYLLSVQEQ